MIGFGAGLRLEHLDEILGSERLGVDWMELITEEFFEDGGIMLAALDRVRREVPVALHGLALGLGDLDPLDARYLARLEALVARAEPVFVSDHLCFSSMAGAYAHELLPLPLTLATARRVADRVCRVQDRLRRRILIENVSAYGAFCGADLTEVDFVREVLERADCHLLLDVNNVYVNARNFGFSAEAYLDAIPAERVAQVHLAGHTALDGFLLDTHIGPIPEAVWALYARFCQRRVVPTLIEWDGEVPPLARIAEECARARSIAVAGGADEPARSVAGARGGGVDAAPAMRAFFRALETGGPAPEGFEGRFEIYAELYARRREFELRASFPRVEHLIGPPAFAALAEECRAARVEDPRPRALHTPFLEAVERRHPAVLGLAHLEAARAALVHARDPRPLDEYRPGALTPFALVEIDGDRVLAWRRGLAVLERALDADEAWAVEAAHRGADEAAIVARLGRRWAEIRARWIHSELLAG